MNEHRKLTLISAAVLQNSDFRRPFHIPCNASKTGAGSVLFQKDNGGEEHSITLVFQKLNYPSLQLQGFKFKIKYKKEVKTL